MNNLIGISLFPTFTHVLSTLRCHQCTSLEFCIVFLVFFRVNTITYKPNSIGLPRKFPQNKKPNKGSETYFFSLLNHWQLEFFTVRIYCHLKQMQTNWKRCMTDYSSLREPRHRRTHCNVYTVGLTRMNKKNRTDRMKAKRQVEECIDEYVCLSWKWFMWQFFGPSLLTSLWFESVCTLYIHYFDRFDTKHSIIVRFCVG